MRSGSPASCASMIASPSTEIMPATLRIRHVWVRRLSAPEAIMQLIHAIRGLSPIPSQRRTAPVEDRLQISEAELAHAIAIGGPSSSLPAIILEHAFTTLSLAMSGIRYLCQGEDVREAYRRMTMEEFARINARQAWANWRTITRNLHHQIPVDRPLVVVDLCCGTGDSTQVLAWWLPAGSQIVGMELDPRFAAAAAGRTYRNRAGDIIPVSVRRSSVLDGFCDHTGARFADASVDVVHAIGSIGCHFDSAQTTVIMRECARVLKRDGIALLDAGNAGTCERDLKAIARRHDFGVVSRSKSWWFDRYVQVVLRRVA